MTHARKLPIKKIAQTWPPTIPVDAAPLHASGARGESAALLALAAVVSGHDDAKDALALTGAILCDVVGLDPAESLDPTKLAEIREKIPLENLLAAADAALSAVRWLNVNADVRLLAENVVAALVTGRE